MQNTTNKDIDFNKKAHDKVVRKYERIHTEIYNKVEQRRLAADLKEAVSFIKTTSKPRSLDIGCGAGNLTQYLHQYGCDVVAADVSTGFLQYINSRFPGVETHELNGEDLREFPDNSFDMVATYSVLHHIPDYLRMVEEMCRVLKPGGVLYIDHERNDSFWSGDPTLLEFYQKQRYSQLHKKLFRKLKNYLNPHWYLNKYKTFQNPRYQEEGDIHVWPDDHIEWSKIKKILARYDFKITKEDEFLLFDSKYDIGIYNDYKDRVTDMKMITAIKS